MQTGLQIKEKELKEAQTNLQETKVPLAKKEYGNSVLENTKENLMSQLAIYCYYKRYIYIKLDHKKAVDRHNALVQIHLQVK